MADLNKPELENGQEPESPSPAETETALDDAMNEMDAFISEMSGASQPEEDPAVSFSGKGAKSMLDHRQHSDEPTAADRKKAAKKAAKKQKRPMSIEEDIADLAEEEKEYDEWGRKIRKKRRKRKKSRKLSCTLVLLTLIVSLSSVLSVTILAVAKEMYGIDKDIEEKIITIPAGAAVSDIAQQLQNEKMLTLPQVFRLVSRMKGKDGDFVAGEHVLSASMSYETMIEELCTNHSDERESVRVTFPEGTTLLRCAEILQENEVITNADDFLFFFNGGGWDFEFEHHLPTTVNPLKFQRMEGYCFPDTYEFYVHEEPNIVAQKIYAHFDSKITEGDYKKMEELGMSLDQVITLASIVQAEAGKESDMKDIASVFHNRLLNSSMFPQLQSDPTRKYAEDVIAPNLQIANQLMCDAYNTYVGPGLPPGAINNPGKAAIEAVLYPNDTPYYYFVANVDTKVTYYAVDNAGHEANIAKIRAEQEEARKAANGEN